MNLQAKEPFLNVMQIMMFMNQNMIFMNKDMIFMNQNMIFMNQNVMFMNQNFTLIILFIMDSYIFIYILVFKLHILFIDLYYTIRLSNLYLPSFYIEYDKHEGTYREVNSLPLT